MDSVETRAPESPSRARGPHRGLFRNRNFRLFFIGQIVSNSGTWLQNVAQGVLVLRLTGRSFMVGVTSAALFVPVLFLALVGGRLADRFDRRRLLIGTQVLALAATGVLALLTATGHVTVWAVIVVAALIGVQYAISIPTMGALLPRLVEPQRLGQAIGMNSVTYNLARVIGPVVAAAAIAWLGFAWAFGLNSLSFVALIVALLLLRLPAGGRPERTGGSIREVMSMAWRSPSLRMMLAAVAAVSIASDPVATLGPAFARQVFHRRGADAGLIVAAFGVGAILAAVLLGRWFRSPSRERFRRVPLTMLLFAAGMAGFAWIPSFWPALVLLVIGGIGYLASSTTWTTALQEEVPDHMRGRIMGLWTIAFLGTRPLAALVDGSVADLAGPRWAVLVVLIPLLVVAAIAPRRLRSGSARVEGADPVEHPAPR
ncbi:MAG: MFS transporter [Actinomycetota bacterium]|nr:MFS transporter [Actinomycetota bacterium]